nr:cation-translocating P-type ATPase C-terminal domain-containing protein [Leptolyngbya sp. CCY15150]
MLAIAYHNWSTEQANWQTMYLQRLPYHELSWLKRYVDRDSLFRLGLFSNKPLLAAVVLTIGLPMSVMYSPVLQPLFQTTSLSAIDLEICVGLSTIIFWAIAPEKWFTRRQQRE